MPVSEEFLADVAHYFHPTNYGTKNKAGVQVKKYPSFAETAAHFKKYHGSKYSILSKEHTEELKRAYNSGTDKALYQRLPKPKVFLPIFSKHDNAFQIDLTHMDAMSGENNTDTTGAKHDYLLTAIDVNSRQAYAYPMKSKNAQTVKETMIKFLGDVQTKTHAPVYSITSDLGSEFINNEFQRLMEKHGVQIYHSNPDDHNKMGKIERFHRTLKTYLRFYMNEEGLPWDQTLPSVMNYYNSEKKSRPIGSTPDKFTPNEKLHQWLKYKEYYKKILGGKSAEQIEDTLKPDMPMKVRIRTPESYNPLTGRRITTQQFTSDPRIVGKIYPSGTFSVYKEGTKDFKLDKFGNAIRYKPYEAKFVNPRYEIKTDTADKIKIARRNRKVEQFLVKEGINRANIINTKRKRAVRVKIKKK